MQKRVNTILAVLAAVSFAVSIGCILIWLELIPVESLSGIVDRCALYFPAVPFLFLQLLLCKVSHRKWIKALPLLLLAAIVVGSGLRYAGASGWDGLGFLLILILCAAPAVGCAGGWVVDWLWRKRGYAASAKSYVLMVVFPVLVLAISVFADWYANKDLQTLYDIPPKETVAAAYEEQGEAYVDAALAGLMREQLHHVWGEPNEILPGDAGDRWSITDGASIIAYYDTDGIVKDVRLERNALG